MDRMESTSVSNARASFIAAWALLALVDGAANEFLTEGRALAIDVRPSDGRIVMDLAGDIWMLESNGGEARLVEKNERMLARPRWSPDGRSLLFLAASDDGSTLRIRDLVAGESRAVGDPGVHNQDAGWHPEGDRIVYSSDRHGTGLDIWETDLPTGLSWRLTSDPGDELSPAWSDNGRHLAWIRKNEEGYAIMLRLHGETDSEFMLSADPLSSLAWRPDGSLFTYLRHGEDRVTLEMAILSEPVLVRTIAEDENFTMAPVAWSDRMNLYYTADGRIRSRGFEDRVSRPVHFRALVAEAAPPPPPETMPRRELLISNAPESRLIIRTARLFDGIWQGYRPAMDIVIDGGRIEAIESRRDREDGIVIDLGNVTAIPGLIDAAAPVPGEATTGASILAYGVTTIVVADTGGAIDPASWETETTPGPRLIVLSADERRTDVSGLADGGLDEIERVILSRQARTFGHTARPARRFAAAPDIGGGASTIVAGSAPNRLPPGAGLHAELLALQTAGLSGEQALHAAGRNAARALGIENQVGTLTPGGLADLVLVNGDPLADVSDALSIVAVVRNGRFFSLVSLLEWVPSPINVD